MFVVGRLVLQRAGGRRGRDGAGGDPGVRPNGSNAGVRQWPAQPGLARHLAGDRRALGHGQRARRYGRRSGARLRDRGMPGQFFGWPWYYIGDHRDLRPASRPPAGLPPVTVPKVLLQAHSASLGAAFYTESQFPAEYRGQSVRSHARLVEPGQPDRLQGDPDHVRRAGRAQPYYEDFMTGFVVSNHEVWGRPVGVAVGTDGSLYVSEDARNTIYCVNYRGSRSEELETPPVRVALVDEDGVVARSSAPSRRSRG